MNKLDKKDLEWLRKWLVNYGLDDYEQLENILIVLINDYKKEMIHGKNIHIKRKR